MLEFRFPARFYHLTPMKDLCVSACPSAVFRWDGKQCRLLPVGCQAQNVDNKVNGKEEGNKRMNMWKCVGHYFGWDISVSLCGICEFHTLNRTNKWCLCLFLASIHPHTKTHSWGQWIATHIFPKGLCLVEMGGCVCAFLSLCVFSQWMKKKTGATVYCVRVWGVSLKSEKRINALVTHTERSVFCPHKASHSVGLF